MANGKMSISNFRTTEQNLDIAVCRSYFVSHKINAVLRGGERGRGTARCLLSIMALLKGEGHCPMPALHHGSTKNSWS